MSHTDQDGHLQFAGGEEVGLADILRHLWWWPLFDAEIAATAYVNNRLGAQHRDVVAAVAAFMFSGTQVGVRVVAPGWYRVDDPVRLAAFGAELRSNFTATGNRWLPRPRERSRRGRNSPDKVH